MGKEARLNVGMMVRRRLSLGVERRVVVENVLGDLKDTRRRWGRPFGDEAKGQGEQRG